MSRKYGGERYVKSFDGYTHLLTMLYAVIQRFDSLREIETSMTAEVRKLHHVGIDTVPKRSTLSDANARRSEKFFEEVYRDLYEANKELLSSDSRWCNTKEWIKRHWSFSGLATIVRIVLMYYLNLEKFLNQPDADLNIMLTDASGSPPGSPEI